MVANQKHTLLKKGNDIPYYFVYLICSFLRGAFIRGYVYVEKKGPFIKLFESKVTFVLVIAWF